MRLHTKRHRPENPIGISGVDIVVDYDNHFAPHRWGFVTRIQNFRGLPRLWVTHLNAAQTPAPGRFVERNLRHVLEAAAAQE